MAVDEPGNCIASGRSSRSSSNHSNHSIHLCTTALFWLQCWLPFVRLLLLLDCTTTRQSGCMRAASSRHNTACWCRLSIIARIVLCILPWFACQTTKIDMYQQLVHTRAIENCELHSSRRLSSMCCLPHIYRGELTAVDRSRLGE